MSRLQPSLCAGHCAVLEIHEKVQRLRSGAVTRVDAGGGGCLAHAEVEDVALHNSKRGQSAGEGSCRGVPSGPMALGPAAPAGGAGGSAGGLPPSVAGGAGTVDGSLFSGTTGTVDGSLFSPALHSFEE